MDEFINFGDSTPGPDFAALAPAINELAEAGDAVAVGSFAAGRDRSVGNVLLVRSKLRRKHGSPAKFRWPGPAA
jgi:N-acetylglucosamine kinase-like BadF-type ATPase